MMAVVAILPTRESLAALPEITLLRDGASILLRPALPSDDARLQRMFYRLSPTSIYHWCFVPAFSHERWAQTLGNTSNLDYHDRYAMVASYAGEIVGIVRYDRNPASQTAECGIVIEDAWQARGLGKLLLGKLILAARSQDVTAFTALILGENRPALRLTSALFDKPIITWQHGECQVFVSLDTFKASPKEL
jgi:RimJ/RimL family protein N-acetyltransferase